MAEDRSLTERLGAFIADAGPPPDDVVDRIRVSLAHNLIIGMAARRHDTAAPGVAARRAGPATLLSDGRRVAPDWAALSNAALMAVRSQDDTHLPSTAHPGAPVIAAALAVAEDVGATGREFLEAVVFGYEILGRVGRDFDKEVSARGFRAAALWSGFGATVAAARLTGLDGRAASHALALAAQQAGGLLQVWREGSPEFPFHLGFGARNGVVAAELAAAGQGGGRFSLEGEAGLYVAAAGATAPPVEALDGLGERWQAHEVTVKPHPACAVLQGPLDLVLSLKPRIGDVHVDGCVLTMHPFEATFPGVDNPGPGYQSATATKMSAQFCLAVALTECRLTFADLSRLDDPAILSLARKIEVRADPGVAERLPHVEIRLSDGRRIDGRVERPAGRPELAEVRLFAARMAPELGTTETAAESLVDAVAALDAAPDTAGLVAAALALGPGARAD